MDFTHYNYKYRLFNPTDNPDRKYDETIFITSDRSEISIDREYYTSWICIYSEDKGIENFCLGIDFSPPGSVLLERCENRLYLNFVIRGKGRFNGKPFSAGQCYYFAPLQKHTVETDQNEPFVSVWLSIEGTYAYDIINRLTSLRYDNILPFDFCSDVMTLTKTFLYKTNLGDMTTSYLRSLIDIYIAHVKSEQSKLPEMFATKKIEKLIRESKIYVRKNLKHVTVSEMAAAQHYNTNYFSRVFTEAMGMTPFEYIIDKKMEWARNALVHSNLSIEEILEAIGYEHRNGFTIAFKKKYGCPPAIYRKKKSKTFRTYGRSCVI